MGEGMNRQHCLRQLLRFGPMSRSELLEVTRWPARAVDRTVGDALLLGMVEPINRHGDRRRSYDLTPTAKALLGVRE